MSVSNWRVRTGAKSCDDKAVQAQGSILDKIKLRPSALMPGFCSQPTAPACSDPPPTALWLNLLDQDAFVIGPTGWDAFGWKPACAPTNSFCNMATHHLPRVCRSGVQAPEGLKDFQISTLPSSALWLLVFKLILLWLVHSWTQLLQTSS